MTAPVSTPTEEGVYVGYSLSTSLPVFVAVCFLDGHFDKNEMESQGTFNLHSPSEDFQKYWLAICISSSDTCLLFNL